MTSVAAGDDVQFRPALFLSSIMQIEPAWIDYNGHLNMAYYNVMFDRAVDELWFKLGIGPTYMKERHGSTFTAECHVRYLREIHLGDPVQVVFHGIFKGDQVHIGAVQHGEGSVEGGGPGHQDQTARQVRELAD